MAATVYTTLTTVGVYADHASDILQVVRDQLRMDLTRRISDQLIEVYAVR